MLVVGRCIFVVNFEIQILNLEFRLMNFEFRISKGSEFLFRSFVRSFVSCEYLVKYGERRGLVRWHKTKKQGLTDDHIEHEHEQPECDPRF